MPTKISGRDKRKQNKTEQNEEEFLPEASERKSTSVISDFQTGEFTGLSNRR